MFQACWTTTKHFVCVHANTLYDLVGLSIVKMESKKFAGNMRSVSSENFDEKENKNRSMKRKRNIFKENFQN